MDKQEILAHYGVLPSQLFGHGMEAKVYTYGEESVLKLYDLSASSTPSTTKDELLTLQNFYNQLDISSLPYAIPRIKQVDHHSSYLVVIEDRLWGRPFAEVIAECTDNKQLDEFFSTYIAAVDALSQIEMPADATQYKLFDPSQLNLRTDGDWHHFLLRYLEIQLSELDGYFARDVAQYGQKVQAMKRALSSPYAGPHRLIHGDFCLGNLLVDDAGSATALLDFGLFTMYGDPVFDLATAWVFFDMYDELGATVHERLLAHIVEQFGEGVRERLYRYVLLYSFIAANTYSPTCTDGHYEWSVANLNNTEYWTYLI